MKRIVIETVRLERIVGGGQVIGTLPGGKRVFAWGGLPDELVRLRLTKQKAGFAEGIVDEVLETSPARIAPHDPDSFMSTSPWQIMDFDAEQRAKADLVREAFELHKLELPGAAGIYSDGVQYGYRNKVEFSWWWDNGVSGNAADAVAAGGPSLAAADGAGGTGRASEAGSLDLAFFIRGGHGKRPVDGTSLARPEINRLARAARDLLRAKHVEARSLKTLLIRCGRDGGCVWQLYVKDRLPDIVSAGEAAALPAIGGEVIYSDPRSPASRITERLASFGQTVLTDHILGIPFQYATEGFFQVNLPVYEQSLRDMRRWVGGGAADGGNGTGPAVPGLSGESGPTVDLYSGVGSIGLTIGGPRVTLVEADRHAFREMEHNIELQGRGGSARPVLAASEKALDYLTADATVIVDPPRAGLHQTVIDRLLAVRPPRIVYLSCNPVTQARDAALLSAGYRIAGCQGYNFFPRTPHIEHLVVLERR